MFVVRVTKSSEKNKEIVMKWMTRESSQKLIALLAPG